MSQTAYNQECLQLARANGNQRLYRLKKADLLKVCNYYGVEILKNPGSNSRVTAVKAVLEARIIEHRDNVFEQDPESVVGRAGHPAAAAWAGGEAFTPALREEMIREIGKVIRGYGMCFTSHNHLIMAFCFCCEFRISIRSV